MIKFSHVGLIVRDLERSVQFYTEVLGLKCLERHPDTTGRGLDIAFVGSDECVLELLCYQDEKKQSCPTTGRYNHFAWYVDDIYKYIDNLKANGIELEFEEPKVVMNGKKIIFFSGPDGERIELVQPAQ